MELSSHKSNSEKSDVTKLLIRLKDGDKGAMQVLFPIVYDNLLMMAGRQLSREGSEHTLNKTDLVHEVFFKLVDSSVTDWQNRGHFYAIAAKAMRQILTDYARKKMAQKRGEKAGKISFDERIINIYKQASELIDIDQALSELTDMNERLAKIVELRFYAGLSMEETGKTLGISSRTVNRDWIKARAWLHNRLQND